MLIKNRNDYLFKGIFLFIFIISGNYLGELLGCRLITLLNNNIIVKHILGFLTLFLTLALTIDLEASLIKLLGISCILYIIFILSSKTTKYINYLLMIIFIIAFILQLYKDRLKRKKTLNNFEKIYLEKIDKYINFIILFFVIILIIIGLLIYIGEQKRTYFDNFNYYRFFIGDVKCSEGTEYINNPNEYWNSLKYTFNI